MFADPRSGTEKERCCESGCWQGEILTEYSHCLGTERFQEKILQVSRQFLVNDKYCVQLFACWLLESEHRDRGIREGENSYFLFMSPLQEHGAFNSWLLMESFIQE